MTNIVQLRNIAVAYAVRRIRDEADYQQLEWEFLNDPQFSEMIRAPDIEDLYDFIGGIIFDADATVDEEINDAEQLADLEREAEWHSARSPEPVRDSKLCPACGDDVADPIEGGYQCLACGCRWAP